MEKDDFIDNVLTDLNDNIQKAAEKEENDENKIFSLCHLSAKTDEFNKQI